MTEKINKPQSINDLEKRIITLESHADEIDWRIRKLSRKQRIYTPEQKATIRARLLAGQEAARKRREGEIKVVNIVKPIDQKKVVNNKPIPSPKQS